MRVPPNLLRRLSFALAMLLGGAVAVAGEAPAGYVDVPVPATMIYAGQPIAPSALTLRRIPSRYLSTMRLVVDASELEGKLARSTLVPGRPITVGQVREPDVIRSSKPVRVYYRAGRLLISGEAIPLSSAREGELVRARTIDGRAVISGIAQADGTLLVMSQ